jgi:hypothetical protein
MASPSSKWIPRNRNTLYLIVGVYMIVALLLFGWQPYLGATIVAVGAASALYLIVRNRPTTGLYSISTDCSSCGAALPQRAGLPASTCPTCGHRQPGAKWRSDGG